jgi:hypothetical protein
MDGLLQLESDVPRYIVAGMTIDAYLSSSDDFAVNAEIIEAATEGLAVPAVYYHQSRRLLNQVKKDCVPFVFSRSHTGR